MKVKVLINIKQLANSVYTSDYTDLHIYNQNKDFLMTTPNNKEFALEPGIYWIALVKYSPNSSHKPSGKAKVTINENSNSTFGYKITINNKKYTSQFANLNKINNLDIYDSTNWQNASNFTFKVVSSVTGISHKTYQNMTCDNDTACNTGELGECNYAGSRTDCEGNALYCTDPSACNYGGDNGSCIYHGSRTDCTGNALYCEDPTACNMNEYGECQFHGSRTDCADEPLYCTDPSACNYGGENGSCIYHGSRTDCSGNPLNCTDPKACNYNGKNGSCVYHSSRIDCDNKFIGNNITSNEVKKLVSNEYEDPNITVSYINDNQQNNVIKLSYNVSSKTELTDDQINKIKSYYANKLGINDSQITFSFNETFSSAFHSKSNSNTNSNSHSNSGSNSQISNGFDQINYNMTIHISEDGNVVNCEDETACNYNYLNGSCMYHGSNIDCGSNPMYCNNSQACNIGELGKCILPEGGYDCDGNFINYTFDTNSVFGSGSSSVGSSYLNNGNSGSGSSSVGSSYLNNGNSGSGSSSVGSSYLNNGNNNGNNSGNNTNNNGYNTNNNGNNNNGNNNNGNNNIDSNDNTITMTQAQLQQLMNKMGDINTTLQSYTPGTFQVNDSYYTTTGELSSYVSPPAPEITVTQGATVIDKQEIKFKESPQPEITFDSEHSTPYNYYYNQNTDPNVAYPYDTDETPAHNYEHSFYENRYDRPTNFDGYSHTYMEPQNWRYPEKKAPVCKSQDEPNQPTYMGQDYMKLDSWPNTKVGSILPGFSYKQVKY